MRSATEPRGPLASVVAIYLVACGGATSALRSSTDAGFVYAPVGNGSTSNDGQARFDGTLATGAPVNAAGDGLARTDASSYVIFCPSGPTFKKSIPLTLGNAPYAVRAGDFNGDGHLDVAVPNHGDGNLSVLFGDGTGHLVTAAGSPYMVGNTPCSEAIGDFNGDGLADIAVRNTGMASVSVLLGRASGPLTPAAAGPFVLGTQAGESCTPATGDFNADGNVDLVVPFGGSLRVLLGDGRGGLMQGKSVSVSGAPFAAVVADFNRDGLPDVAAANYTGNAVNVFIGDGRGGLSSAPGSPWPIGSSTAGLATGDFNHDGWPDLAVVDLGGGAVSILLGDGKWGFANAPGSPIFVGSTPTDATIADFDGDGNLDLAVAVNGTSAVAILRGNGTGAFASAAGSPMSVGPYPGSLTAGDFNEDGRFDIALTNNIPGTWTVSLLLNTCAP